MSTRVDRRLNLITPQQQRYDADAAADWLEAIRRQVCPFCNAGPFVVVAIHVAMVHGIDRKTLRDMLGVMYSESICDPDYSSRMRDISRGSWREGRFGAQPKGRHPGIKVSDAAREASRANLARARDVLNQQRRAAPTKSKHGSYSRYSHGCRCASCREANTEHSRMIRRRHRSEALHLLNGRDVDPGNAT